jgi:2-polyprenyl-3-methyl-5-hydroxy-6-metoxy-1,4-benzoquinol methylase
MTSINEIIDDAGSIKKLAICVPMRGKVDAIFMQSYLALFIHLLKKRGIVAQPIFGDQMPLDKARNSLAKSSILNKADYALWLDSDIVMTEKHFEQAWETLHARDDEGNERFIVTGIYYERELPYDAVIRRKNELGLYEKIMQFPEDKPFTVDGMGFGFVLMKMQPMKDAFAVTKGFPFRWTDKVSEDLHFCELMNGCQDLVGVRMVDKEGKPITYKMWCDPRIQIPHYGSYTTQWHYLHYKLDEYQDVQELMRFKKIKSEECYQRCVHGALNMCKAWTDRFGKDAKEEDLKEEDVLEFYRSTDLYLYDLTWYWSHNRNTRDTIMNHWREKQERVLDFGCGIGDYGLAYAAENPKSAVDFYDINRENLAYVAHRINVREVQNIIEKGSCQIFNEAEGKVLMSQEERYDMIFAFDVLEHMKNPIEGAANIRRMLKRNGLLMAQVAPKGMFQPQHIGEIDLCQHGFLQTDTFMYVRSDSDIAVNYVKIVQGVKDNMSSAPMKDEVKQR